MSKKTIPCILLYIRIFIHHKVACKVPAGLFEGNFYTFTIPANCCIAACTTYGQSALESQKWQMIDVNL